MFQDRVLRGLASHKDYSRAAESVVWFKIYKLNLSNSMLIHFAMRPAEVVWNFQDLPIIHVVIFIAQQESVWQMEVQKLVYNWCYNIVAFCYILLCSHYGINPIYILQGAKPFVLPSKVQVLNNIPAFGDVPLPPGYVKWALQDRNRFLLCYNN